MWKHYYWRWLLMAFRPAFSVADQIATAISILGPPIVNAISFQNAGKFVSNLSWQIPLGLMVAVFVVRLVPAPYWMFKEDEAKREIDRSEEMRWRGDLAAQLNRMEALLSDKFNRAEKKSCIAVLIRDGKTLKDRHVQGEQLKWWTPDYQEWMGRVESEVREKFGDADSLRLSTLDYKVGHVPGAASGDHQKAICRIAAILEELQAMFRSLSSYG